MTYEEAIEIIHSYNVFGSRLGLDRMLKLLELLGNPQDGLRIIHVAGTNGKGSVCRYVYSVLTEAGYKTGAYFSPYLERFTERIELGGQEITQEALVRNTERAHAAAQKMVAEGLESPTEFELVTAIGLLYYAEEKADYVILEVGLGGRGDSTNICPSPEVTAITSISFDHMAQLGNTLEQIAYDKAGIIKKGVPVVICVDDVGAADTIMKEAALKGAPVIDVRNAQLKDIRLGRDGSDFWYRDTDHVRHIEISMPGRHQINNALVALHMIEVLKRKGVEISEEALKAGMKKAVQPARFEVIARGRAEGDGSSRRSALVLDGAHNRAGIRALVDTVKTLYEGARILICTGMLADKEFDIMADMLCELDGDLLVTTVPNPRTKPAAELAEVFYDRPPYKNADRDLSPVRTITVCENYEKAVELAQSRADDYDLILWTGSLYLIGPVRSLVKF